MIAHAHSPLVRPVASWIRFVVSRRSVRLLLAVWVTATIATVPIADGRLPFDRPQLAAASFASQVGFGWLNLAAALLLTGIACLVTRKRAVPDIAARVPAGVAAGEAAVVIAYGLLVQLGGVALGRAIGTDPMSLHLPGTLYGASDPASPGEALVWIVYNFALFAVVPYLWFRRRGYSHEQLGLRSSDRKNDALLIVVILAVESFFELTGSGAPIFDLGFRQFVAGASLSFLLNLFGTVLPVMIFLYAILLPRLLRLTGSAPATVVLGGVAYASMHVFEAWAVYDSARNALLSVIFLMVQYVPPGIVKSVLTLRTGNAWVHAWAYHAIAPHTHVDAPNAVDIFDIR